MQNMETLSRDKKIEKLSVIGINDGTSTFAEKPSNEFALINAGIDVRTLGESIDAYSLFSIFTADIILLKTVFVR